MGSTICKYMVLIPTKYTPLPSLYCSSFLRFGDQWGVWKGFVRHDAASLQLRDETEVEVEVEVASPSEGSSDSLYVPTGTSNILALGLRSEPIFQSYAKNFQWCLRYRPMTVSNDFWISVLKPLERFVMPQLGRVLVPQFFIWRMAGVPHY